jgi:predicted PurR-regulated permease PerM
MLIAAVLTLCILRFSQIIGFALSLWNVMLPVIAGLVMAYVFNIVETRLESVYFPKSQKLIVNKTRKPVAITMSALIIITVLIMVAVLVLPKVIDAIISIASAIPSVVEIVNGFINEHKDSVPLIADSIGQINIDGQGISDAISGYAINVLGNLMSSMFGFATNLVSGLFNLIMSITVLIHLLSGKEKLLARIRLTQKAFMKERHAQALNCALSVANETFSNYIFGQCAEALILGGLCTLGMWVFRFPFASTAGVFMGVTALVPVVGAYIGAGTVALLILTVDPLKALFFIVYVVVLQQLENNLIYPRVVGKSVRLPGIWVLVSVVVGGGLFGIAGMMISVPFTATAYKLFGAVVKNRAGARRE